MLRLKDIEKSFTSKPLLSGVNFQFNTGQRFSLVGENGAGKTTLLDIICQKSEPDAGAVLLVKDVKVAYLSQEPSLKPEATILMECMKGSSKLFAQKLELAAFVEKLNKASADELAKYEELESDFRREGGYQLEARSQAMLLGLGFKSEDFSKDPKSLSGGWRMRLELCKLLIGEPDLLVLDEPTNHLDLPSLVWVENYLKNFKGSLLFVSHDESLLNRLAENTLHLHRGKLKQYKGNYAYFLEQREKDEQQNRDIVKNLEEQKKPLVDFIARFSAKASKAKQAQSKQKLLDKIDAQLEQVHFEEKEKEIVFSPKASVKAEKVILKIENLSIGYGQKVLAKKIEFLLQSGQKIAIIGANGIGKSTLLKTIAGIIPPLVGEVKKSERAKIAYFSQNIAEELDGDGTLIDNICKKSPVDERMARMLLAQLGFRQEEVEKKVKVLSGGEKNRLGLAILLAQPSSLLLLDEPTNHLDIKSIRALTKGLKNYDGSLLFVSHNRVFIDAVCTHILAIDAQMGAMLFEGQLSDYQRLAALSGFRDVIAVENSQEIGSLGTVKNKEKVLGHEEQKRIKALERKLQKKLLDLENKMTKWQDELVVIEGKLALQSKDYEAMSKTLPLYEQLKTELERAEEEWLNCSKELENMQK